MTRIWIGPRESDILTLNGYFDKSITFYGSNGPDNYAYCSEYRLNNYYDDKYYNFIFDSLGELTDKDSDCVVHTYSGSQAHKVSAMRPELGHYFKYINEAGILEWFNNKTYSRVWMENSVGVPRYALLSKPECTYGSLSSKYPGFDEFILQLNHSSGGKGTWKMNCENEDKLFGEIPDDEPLLVSPYYSPSISANCHMVIGERVNVLFPTSAQIIKVQNDKMIYSGGDFAYGKKVDAMMGEKLYKFKAKTAEMMSKTGYRGVCGIDFLVCGEQIYLIEINPRYQGSTFVVNNALTKRGYPHMTELTVAAFENTGLLEEWKDKLESIEIEREGHVISLSPDTTLEAAYKLLEDVRDSHEVFLDGFLDAVSFESSPYLFKYF